MLQEAAQTSNVIRQSSVTERNGLRDLTRQSGEVLVATRDSVRSIGTAALSVKQLTDSVTADTVPVLNTSIKAVGDAATDVDQSSVKFINNSQLAINDLDRILADPSWHNALYHIDKTTASIDDGTAELDTTLHNILNPRKRSFWETTGLAIIKALIPKPYLVIN